MPRTVLMLLACLAALPARADRFPQPVRAGDLVGRKLIGPVEAQPLLGIVQGIDRAADGSQTMRVRTWSLLPWWRRDVDLPLATVALLGEEVALVGMSGSQYRALPTAGGPHLVDPNEQLRIGLARPFH